MIVVGREVTVIIALTKMIPVLKTVEIDTEVNLISGYVLGLLGVKTK